MDVTPGLYNRYDGKVFMVIGVAKDAMTRRHMVVYRHIEGTQLFVMDLKHFCGFVEVSGEKSFHTKSARRFEKTGA